MKPARIVVTKVAKLTADAKDLKALHQELKTMANEVASHIEGIKKVVKRHKCTLSRGYTPQ